MDPQEQGYRQAAAECLEAAQTADNQSIRTKLLTMAQQFLELANNPLRRSWRRMPDALHGEHRRVG
jgi:hypothetical protein